MKYIIPPKDELQQLLETFETVLNVSKHTGIPKNTLHRYYSKYNIPKPTRQTAPHLRYKSIPFSSEFMEFFDGIMLSDGHIKTLNESRTGSFSLSTPFVEYRDAIKNVFDSYKIPSYTRERITDAYSTGTGYSIESTTTIEFGNEHKRWYRKGLDKENIFVKIIPNDLRNAPMMWKWELIGDGCLSQSPKSPLSYQIVLSTDSFSKSEILFLIEKLAEHKIKSHIFKRKNNHYRIAIYKDTRKFIKFIGNCPVDFFKYKLDAKDLPIIKCNQCNRNFEQKYGFQKFCSKTCSQKSGNLRNNPRKHPHLNKEEIRVLRGLLISDYLLAKKIGTTD